MFRLHSNCYSKEGLPLETPQEYSVSLSMFSLMAMGADHILPTTVIPSQRSEDSAKLLPQQVAQQGLKQGLVVHNTWCYLLCDYVARGYQSLEAGHSCDPLKGFVLTWLETSRKSCISFALSAVKFPGGHLEPRFQTRCYVSVQHRKDHSFCS